MTVPCTIHQEKTVDKTAYDLAMRFGKKAQRHFPDSYVYLFGSHAIGNPHPESDIDVAVIVDSIKGCEEDPYFALCASNFLYGMGVMHFGLVEAHLIQADYDVSGFLGTIVETGIQLLEPAGPIKCQVTKRMERIRALLSRPSVSTEYKKFLSCMSDTEDISDEEIFDMIEDLIRSS